MGTCRVPEHVLAAGPFSKVQIQVKKAKQHIAKLQRRQWANGIVSFTSKVRMSKPLLPSSFSQVYLCLHACIREQTQVFLFGSERLLVLQLVIQTQKSDAKILQNAAVIQWHKDTQEQARLAR